MSSPSANPVDWSFEGTWPYEAHYFETPHGSMHFIDEGSHEGDLTVLVHGNPTWGYLYRRFVAPLRAVGARVVVPDLLGFGRSDKPLEVGAYQLDQHVERMSALLASLGDRPVTIVAHDWGGPISLAWAASQPERLARLVLMNTFGPRLPRPLRGDAGFRLLRRVVRLPGAARYLYQRRNVMVEEFLFDKGLAKAGALGATAREAYRAPHPTVDSRVGIAAFPLQIPRTTRDRAATLSRDTLERLQTRLLRIPVMLVWGGGDVLFGTDVLDEWRQVVPHAEVVELPGAGHYLQEDQPDEAIAAVLRCFQIDA